jgi:hypothetical protein
MSEPKLFLSNRGNVDSQNPKKENTIDHLTNAYDRGFCLKTDIWVIKDSVVTGVGHPNHAINLERFSKDRLLIQARNPAALLFLLQANYHCFWRETDELTITNKGFVLSFSSMLFPNSILMKPEDNMVIPDDNYLGICSDFISGYV